MSQEDNPLRAKAEEVYARLLEAYGEPQWQPGQNALDTLIGTILSANTNDVNSGRAFGTLKSDSTTAGAQCAWLPLDDIKHVIRTAGMYNQKAPHIVGALGASGRIGATIRWSIWRRRQSTRRWPI